MHMGIAENYKILNTVRCQEVSTYIDINVLACLVCPSYLHSFLSLPLGLETSDKHLSLLFNVQFSPPLCTLQPSQEIARRGPFLGLRAGGELPELAAAFSSPPLPKKKATPRFHTLCSCMHHLTGMELCN